MQRGRYLLEAVSLSLVLGEFPADSTDDFPLEFFNRTTLDAGPQLGGVVGYGYHVLVVRGKVRECEFAPGRG